MRFFSVQTRGTYSIPENTIKPSNQSMIMTIRPKMFFPNTQVQIPTPVISNPPEKKVKWGEPTWFLFHTLSVKIKDSEFASIRNELLNQIYAICINLPCPDCANHAKTYLEGINFNAIQTKTDLKKMLHIFHNSVNQRKSYPLFPYDELDKKYSTAITSRIIQNFMVHFSDRNRSIKLLPSDLHRQRLCISLKEWFNKNISLFDP
jgi:hypothetical protein